MNLTRGINLRKIAELMPGASGAEVKVGITRVNLKCLDGQIGVNPAKTASWVCSRESAQRQGCTL